MSIDEWRTGDVRVVCEGVFVVIAPASRELLEGVTVDYVELEPGDFRFIFSAPQAARVPTEQP
jgi:iron-sulfur cluster assembly protein